MLKQCTYVLLAASLLIPQTGRAGRGGGGISLNDEWLEDVRRTIASENAEELRKKISKKLTAKDFNGEIVEFFEEQSKEHLQKILSSIAERDMTVQTGRNYVQIYFNIFKTLFVALTQLTNKKPYVDRQERFKASIRGDLRKINEWSNQILDGQEISADEALIKLGRTISESIGKWLNKEVQGSDVSLRTKKGKKQEAARKSRFDKGKNRKAEQQPYVYILQQSWDDSASSDHCDPEEDSEFSAEFNPDRLPEGLSLSSSASGPEEIADIFVGEIPESISELIAALTISQEDMRHFDPYSKNNLLLHGPTGTGKTTLARVVAAKAGLPFFQLNTTSISGTFVTEAEFKITQIFKYVFAYARAKNTRVVLLVDEIDQLLSNGGESGSSIEDHNRSLVSVFLKIFGEQGPGFEFEGILDQVVLIGTTNYLSAIPENARGRFAIVQEVSAPNDELRFKVLCQRVRQIPAMKNLSDDFLKRLAKTELKGFNLRQICDVVRKAGRKSLVLYSNKSKDLIGNRVMSPDSPRLKSLDEYFTSEALFLEALRKVIEQGAADNKPFMVSMYM